MKTRRLTARRLLWLAFALSLLVHLTMLGSGLVSFETVDMPDDPRLRQLSAKLDSMALDEPPVAALQMPALAGAAGPGREASGAVADTPPQAPRKKAKRMPKKVPPPEASAVAMAPPSVAVEASQPLAPAPTVVAAVESSAPTGETVKPEQPIRRFPQAARIRFNLLLSGLLVGQADMVWQRDGSRYRLVTDVVPAIGPKVHYETTGSVGKRGLRPEIFAGSRNGEPRERAEFDWAAGELRYGDRSTDKREPLLDGAQDWLGLGVQLALRGDSMGEAPTQITTGKKVYSMVLSPAGETDFDTGDGVMRAVVVRVKQPDELYEFWLAPDFANIPIRVLRVNKETRMELRANLIELAGQTVWQQAPRKQRLNESKR